MTCRILVGSVDNLRRGVPPIPKLGLRSALALRREGAMPNLQFIVFNLPLTFFMACSRNVWKLPDLRDMRSD